ncbi:cytochrome c biogenesis protein [Shouchella clausii KSM-K16]|uniref:Cytochrome c biogenesis protein n=1 Tax=Shouchella clausii (strain KSM-K16) TaxID=66692 RepID=Q5WDX5_SHOC1|nr:cytochrome c biogenesis protein CcdC [Shouchella clausii]BAD65435.1 cytochrome c biogenesis protein [Shouchella clausii KSM-K16]
MENNWLLIAVPTLMAVAMGSAALVIRMKASKRPTSAKRIMVPPLAMSTGFLMFLYEPTRPSAFHVGEALIVGALFSIVLIWTSKFEVRDGAIYLKRSKAFAYFLIGLLVLRVAFRIVMGQELNPEELSGMFFLLAYGMLLPWRVAMLVRYVKLKRDSDKVATYKP